MKTGILFDLDGTLLDTLEDLLNATNYALAQRGHPPRTLEELRRFVGNGAENQIRLSLPEGASPEEVQAVLGIYKPYYAAHCRKKTRPYPGIPDALAEIQKKYPVAIVTNKPHIAAQPLCAELFPGIFTLGETPDCPRKPAPDMFRRAMEALGVDRCVCVGDSEVDVYTGKNADMDCLCVLWGFRSREQLEAAGGKFFCGDPKDLPGKLERFIDY